MNRATRSCQYRLTSIAVNKGSANVADRVQQPSAQDSARRRYFQIHMTDHKRRGRARVGIQHEYCMYLCVGMNMVRE
jgi:hypothetical protein